MSADQPGPGIGSGAPPKGAQRRRFSPRQIRQLGVGALAALLVLFAILNLDRVKVNWIVTTSQTPLIVVIAVAFVVGALVGLLVARSRSGATKD